MDRQTATGLALSVVKRELQELLFINFGVNLTKPSDIRISLTDRCNYRCGYCDHWQRERYVDEHGLDFWVSIVNGLADYLGSCSIQFSGGEPTVSPVFLPLVEHCSKIGVRWGLITNGSRLKGRVLDRLVQARPLNVDISIDSSRPAVHDSSRGVDGSLARLTSNLTGLLAARTKAGQHFPVRIKPTVHAFNFNHLTEIVEWAAGIGDVLIDFSPVRLPRGPARTEFYLSSDEDLLCLERQVDQLLAMQRSGMPIETSQEKLLAMVAHFRGERSYHGKAKCRVGLRTFDIRPDGVVNHCWRFHNVGNLTSETPDAIWERTRREIAKPATDCSFATSPRCATACTAKRSFVQEVRRGLRYVGGAGSRREAVAISPAFR